MMTSRFFEMYTNGQKKGYKIVNHIVLEMQKQVLFDTSENYMHVIFEWDCLFGPSSVKRNFSFPI